MELCNSKNAVLDRIRGGLVVSCQALPEEPLHGSHMMARVAYAAYLGGAAGIRANTIEDIRAIREEVTLPIIGIIKREYAGSSVYITPTQQEVDALVNCGVEIIAIDATERPRPGGQTLDDFFSEVRRHYPAQLFMADCSNVAEGMHAAQLGFDIIGTTMAGYTPYTHGTSLPDYTMMEALVNNSGRPVIAEGGIWSPEQLKRAMDCGVLAAVVGTAITRPMEITRRYIAALKG